LINFLNFAQGGPQNPQAQDQTQKQKENQACLERAQIEINANRQRFRDNFGRRLLFQAGLGAARGAILGGIAGGIGGGALFGVGAVPGAILGGVTGGILGAAGG
jgi:predicted lipid-binding transport protein (Tim44 family)